MTEPVRIIGSPISPYVRKVLVCLNEKGIEFEIDPIVPFFGNDRFSEVSPLRRIPVYIDDQVTLCDSSVICQYLEDRFPSPALYPASIVDRARARWLEEFADTRMGEVFIWRLFNQAMIRPAVWGEAPDPEIVDKALNHEIPAILDYLESLIPAEGFLFGSLSIADISIATFFRNAAFVRFQVDKDRWPRTASFVERLHKHGSFAKLAPIEKKMLRTPLPEHRTALAELGVRLTPETYGTTTPRRGIMRT
jgi:glutathione S-transferase